MKPKSDTLFHFTKSLDTLKLMLKNGFWPRYCLEDVDWVDIDDAKFVAFPMVCFCDIPLSRVDEHVDFYGNFGIGLTKEWAISNGLTPIQYVSSTSGIPEAYRHLVELLDDGTSDANIEGWVSLRYMFAHTKPLKGKMLMGQELVEKSFHQESEWRYVAKNENVRDFLDKNHYESEEFVTDRNAETKKHSMLKFTPKDIRYVFVKNDSDIPAIINFIQSEMDEYPSADVKVLLSRVTSLESITLDL
ncbi:abortive infection system antitoxin AbiGi family protein [Thalassotalea montiporae]